MAEEIIKNVNDNKSDKNLFEKVVSKFKPDAEVFTAESAWCQSAYGRGSYKPVDKRIEDKQKHIKASIESKFACSGQTVGTVCFSSYHCIIDIEEDLKNHVDEVFKPFKDNGFNIINLSEKIDEIKDELVFMISWKNAFNK